MKAEERSSRAVLAPAVKAHGIARAQALLCLGTGRLGDDLPLKHMHLRRTGSGHIHAKACAQVHGIPPWV